MTTPIILLGSSRSFGNTRQAVDNVIANHSDIPIVDLNTIKMLPYDYEYRNQNDDYLSLMENVVQHDLIVLATPVYWYTMSATMKIFIDRLSDLLDIRKDLGRKLRNKHMYLITTFDTSFPTGFENIFAQTCEFMGINYEGCSYFYYGSDPDLLQRNAVEQQRAVSAIFPGGVNTNER